ncbi:MAG: DNA repair exonuclease [Brumimicrobium sp.]
MSSFKFIHAADLHIESPYKGISHLNQELGRALVNYGIQAYEKLIETCIDEKIDFLLIAGDSFDSDAGSLSAQYRFVKGLEVLKKANISVFIICGNHDPLNNWSSHLTFPDNVTLFEGETVQQHTVFKEKSAVAEIYGVSYSKKEEFRNLAEQYERNDRAEFAIGLLHGTMAGRETKTPYCPFDMDSLRASNMDYWALGHIHKREVVSDNNPMVVYPGNIQGRHFNETGEKGCSLVYVEEGAVKNHDFISLSNVVFDYKTIDVTNLESLSAFFNAVEDLKNELLKSDQSHLLRIQLKGKTPLHQVFSRRAQIEELISDFNNENSYQNSFVFIDKIINLTKPVIDLEERKKSNDFIGDLIARFDDYAKDPKAMIKLKDSVMEEMMSTKVGRHLNNEAFEEEILNEFGDILNTAKWKCIDGLINNESKE